MSLLKPRILIVEDEPTQVEVLRYNLAQEGYAVSVEIDGEEGVRAALEDPPDLILLDWMLPNLSGIEACRQLRRAKQTCEIPIILLTARSEERDKIRGLDIGADDYITKPYSLKELIARIRSAMRRPTTKTIDEKFVVGGVEVDLEKHRATFNGKLVDLGPTEFRLLVTLVRNPERVFSRNQLLDSAWGITAEIESRTVDVHIGRLRRSLENAGGIGIIRTIRGFGYSLDVVGKGVL